MRKLLAAFAAATVAVVLAMPSIAHAAGPSVDPNDDKVTGGITYVRHDGGTDATIQACNDKDLAAFGAFTQNNEPFSVVAPSNPNLVVTGWNDYCSDWMGLGFSTDGGETWTDSLVPGYPADTSTEGMTSPEFGRTNNASDPVAAFNGDGSMFYFGFLAYNGFAGPKTNSDAAVARYAVRDPSDPAYQNYPLDYLGTTQIGKGPAAANFNGIFNDKDMIEVDQTGGSHDGNIYSCWTKFPAFGTPTIRFRASSDGGQTYAPPVNLTEGGAGQGCDITVEADGDVYVIWRDFELSSSHKNFGVSFARSTDGGLSFSPDRKIRDLVAYNPFDGARDCGDGVDLCPSGFVFHRVPLEPRITSDPTGELPGVFAIYNAVDPSTMVPTTTTYTSAGFGTGMVGRSFVYVARSLNDGQTWTPVKVDGVTADGHQYFPDGDALAGRLAVVWQDSREDPCYSAQLPVDNTASATKCDDHALNTYAAVSTDGVTFGSSAVASSVGQMPQYEMFDAASVPFLGDYNWIDLIELGDGSLFGYLSWTDNRDVVPGNDPREATQDGFDVTGWFTDANGNLARNFNAGGYDQNIYGNSVTIP
ncbi:MAG: glycoside hydrolase [Actinomycetota bacterium]|nr:glycoside hydrolase [Actinomycetota bacterium]